MIKIKFTLILAGISSVWIFVNFLAGRDTILPFINFFGWMALYELSEIKK